MAENKTWSVSQLLNRYKETLKPGVYFFYGKWDGKKLVGIEESMEPYPSVPLQKKYGVTFGYYLRSPYKGGSEKISAMDELKNNPFFSSVEKTPEIFQEALMKYLTHKLRAKRS